MTYLEDRPMSEVLDKYGNIADEIELVSFYKYSKDDDGFPPFTEEDYRRCEEMDRLYLKNHNIRRLYESPKYGLGSKFRDFDEFYDLFIRLQNDLRAIRSGDGPYHERKERLFEEISKEKDIDEEILDNLNNFDIQHWWDIHYTEDIEKTLPAYICGELNEPQNAELKEAFISVRLTHAWHCTLSSAVRRLFRFRLTDGVKRWLSRYELVFDLKGLEDLAFYKDDRLLYSSCTHEWFDNDYLDE